jgi:hypothetical protein
MKMEKPTPAQEKGTTEAELIVRAAELIAGAERANGASSVAMDLPNTVPHAFEPELRADAQRLDATFRTLIVDLRTTDSEYAAEQASLAATRRNETEAAEALFKKRQSEAQQALNGVRSKAETVKRYLRRGREHPILTKVKVQPTAFPADVDHPVARFEDQVRLYHRQADNGSFDRYRPASIPVRLFIIATIGGLLTIGAYYISADTSLMPGIFAAIAA